MRIYLDNAATTSLDKEVFNAMIPYLLEHYGNPSSHHQQGQQVRKAIEECRITIANLLNALPEEIIFTSGGTEADNMAIFSAVYSQKIANVITTRFEHHAVLHTLNSLQSKGLIKVNFIRHDTKGTLDLDHLEQLLQTSPRSLVSVMHANNEIGNLNDIERISELCAQNNALFHSDTVQTIGHYSYDLQKLKVHFLAASAHKFHGPKGVGFIFCRQGIKLTQLIHGGGQENQLRAGTENISGIIGLTKALELAYKHLEEHQQYVQGLKSYMIECLLNEVPGIRFNGNSAAVSKSLYTILNVGLPVPNNAQNLLRCLDELEISVSGGSACSTGSVSHVLQAISTDRSCDNIRFSFSKLNSRQEIDLVIKALNQIYQSVAA
ncbi:MAG: cysteine desulfurase [Sphingobacteriaceae bacterium]|nr:MAG: cysteine desulfurase [Sphingobacteriaceae bacterium]